MQIPMSFTEYFLYVCNISYPECNSITIHWIILETQAFSISLHPYKGTIFSKTYYNKQKIFIPCKWRYIKPKFFMKDWKIVDSLRHSHLPFSEARCLPTFNILGLMSHTYIWVSASKVSWKAPRSPLSLTLCMLSKILKATSPVK